jgi:hypothetical protein
MQNQTTTYATLGSTLYLGEVLQAGARARTEPRYDRLRSLGLQTLIQLQRAPPVRRPQTQGRLIGSLQFVFVVIWFLFRVMFLCFGVTAAASVIVAALLLWHPFAFVGSRGSTRKESESETLFEVLSKYWGNVLDFAAIENDIPKRAVFIVRV